MLDEMAPTDMALIQRLFRTITKRVKIMVKIKRKFPSFSTAICHILLATIFTVCLQITKRL